MSRSDQRDRQGWDGAGAPGGASSRPEPGAGSAGPGAVLAESMDASRCIGYLTKYLSKHLGDCHQPNIGNQADHAAQLADALRYEPCSRPVRTGSATASSPRTQGPACGQAHARARPTVASTSDMPGAACWYPASDRISEALWGQ